MGQALRKTYTPVKFGNRGNRDHHHSIRRGHPHAPARTSSPQVRSSEADECLEYIANNWERTYPEFEAAGLCTSTAVVPGARRSPVPASKGRVCTGASGAPTPSLLSA